MYGLVLMATFLSTLPARGATQRPCSPCSCLQNFYPRSPRGERPAAQQTATQTVSISIHAPREGSDRFQTRAHTRQSSISIHAPREGSDAFFCLTFSDISDFYPRSPRGERL